MGEACAFAIVIGVLISRRIPDGFLPSAVRSATSRRMASPLATDDAARRRCEDLASPAGVFSTFSSVSKCNDCICVQVYVGAGKRDYVPVEQRVPVEGLRQTPSAVEHGG